jgi:arylsulfatase
VVRRGEWKLRWQFKPFGKGEWELFNVVADPTERQDLAAQHPEKVRELLAFWDDYAAAYNVILPNRSMFETLEDQLPMRVPVESGYPPLIYKRQFVPPQEMLADPKS